MLTLLLVACTGAAPLPKPQSPPSPAKVREAPAMELVLLGTGTPVPDPERSGPATALLVGGLPLIFDAGPGLVRRTQQAATKHSMPALAPGNLHHVFLTHLHSDHTTGLPDLLLGGWVLGRSRPMKIWGPPGTRTMVDGILAAWAEDVGIRQGVEDLPGRGIDVEVVELEGGVAFDDGDVNVQAFVVDHGTWDVALGYRVEAQGRVVVISGDTAPTEAVVKACDGCDLLLHEVYAKSGFDAVNIPSFHRYHGTFHTSGLELGVLAARARPKQLVLHHQLFFGMSEEVLLREVAMGFKGPTSSGADLDRIRIER